MLRSLLILFLISVVPAFATAQVAPAPQPQQPPLPPAIANWPSPPPNGQIFSGHIYIETFAAPGVRQRCHILALTADAITCRASHHRPPTVYQRTQILSITGPPGVNGFLLGLGIVALLLVILAFSSL